MSEVPLRDHLESRLVELDRRVFQAFTDRDARVDAALASAKEAVAKAEVANEHRLGLLNEFRAQQADEARKYALNESVDTKITGLNERLGRVEMIASTLQGRALALAGFGALFGAVVGALIVKMTG